MFDFGITERKLLQPLAGEDVNNASLIILSYPHEPVRVTEALYSSILRFAGIGTKGWVRAGHSCMAIVRRDCPTIEYFDFGRYISPAGRARARGANTDPDVTFEIEAEWRNGEIANIEQIVGWIYDHPEKTRGEGDLYASVCKDVNYERVMRYIDMIQQCGVLPYGPFVKGGTNCCRFVTDAMLNGVLDPVILRRVKRLYRFTSSGLTNVEAANSYPYYWVATTGSVQKSTKSLRKIQRAALMDWGKGYENVPANYIGSVEPPMAPPEHHSWRWLGGIGCGVWYKIEAQEDTLCYAITQYSNKNKFMWSAEFRSEQPLDLEKPYHFEYPSHYAWAMINVDGKVHKLTRVVTP